MQCPCIDNRILRTWQFYRDFFQFAFLRYMIFWFALVPAVLYAVQDVPATFTLPAIGQINFGLPFSWWILWIGSVFFVLAYILYLAFCPTFVTRYYHFGDYKAYGHAWRWIVWETKNLLLAPAVNIEKFMERMTKKKYVEVVEGKIADKPTVKVLEEYTELLFPYDGRVWSFKMPIAKNDLALNDLVENEVFWEVFGRFADSRPGIRRTISVSLIIAVVCVVVVVAENIWTVAGVLIHDFGALL